MELTADRPHPLRVAIVGAGPAGFYAAGRLLRDRELGARVELIDRLPTPWGLVRSGVAPDHQKIKNVTRVYEQIAALPGFRFHGNVAVGRDVSHAELRRHHHAVIYAYGSARDRRLGIPGEDLPGSHAGVDFVAWYNGHPDARELDFDLSVKRAVVIGNGNVALDVARMLCLDADTLAGTDMADHAIEALARSEVEEVVVLGRRGPAQAAFTTPELRELGELDGVRVVVDPRDAELDPASAAWLERAGATAQRNVEVIREFARRPESPARRRLVLRFLLSPEEILGEERVTGIRVRRNELVADEDGKPRARATEEREVIDCGLVLRCIGYRGVGIEGVPFDEASGTVPNERGRVLADGAPCPGVYVAGWIKRGPSGVIGTNKLCAHETVESLLEDHAAGRLPAPEAGEDEFLALLAERVPDRVDYAGWEEIDRHERARGEEQGRPRVKVTRREDLVAIASGALETT